MVIFSGQINFDKSVALPYYTAFQFAPCGEKNNLSEVKKMAECPVCGADITLEADAEQGEIIACDDCGSELEVTGKDSLQEAPQEEEDWGE
jgi:alpha-aminoadipate carrier protein LysW